MSLTWGAAAGTNAQQVGIEIVQSPATVTTATASVELTIRFYVFSSWSVNDNQVLTLSGDATGTHTQGLSPLNQVGVNVLVATVVQTVNLIYGQTQARSYGAVISGHYGGATPSHSRSWTVPARPFAVPSAPTIGANTRVSDTQNTAAWTNNPTTAGPYTNILVQRSVNGGTWTQIATLAGTATSFSDTTTAPNTSNAYRVLASNSAGTSAPSASSTTTHNTPAAPGTPAAVLTTATQVTLSAADNSATETAFAWQETVNDGAAWSDLGTSAADTPTFVRNNPPGGTVRYRVRATRDTLASAWSAMSNAVTTTQPPAAPAVTPLPAHSLTGATLPLAWQHASLDGSAQSAAEVEVTRNGTPTVHTTTTAQTLAASISGLAAGSTVSVRVRTRGVHASFGPWSAATSTTLTTLPAAAITTPATDGATVTAGFTAAWTYSGHLPQASWTLTLAGPSRSRVWHGTAETSHAVAPADLTDDSPHTLTLTVRATSGFTATVVRTFAVDFAPPTAPSVYALFDLATLSAEVIATAGATGANPPTAALSVERTDADGTVSLVAANVTSGSSVIDPTPPLGTVTYRAVASAASGARSTAAMEVATASEGRFAVNFGARLLVLDADPQRTRQASTSHDLLAFAGRGLPVLYAGEARAETVSLAASTADPATVANARALGAHRGQVLYRSPDGDRFEAAVTNVGIADGAGPVSRISLALVRVSP